MKISIVQSEKKILPFYQKAAMEYDKRLSRYCKMDTPSSISKKQQEKQDCLPIHVICNSPTISSEEFAIHLSDYTIQGYSHLIFLLDKSMSCQIPSSCETFSLCEGSLSYDLACVLLREQIYRCFRILNNEPYHK